MVAIWLMKRSSIKQENDGIGTCLHLMQDQVFVVPCLLLIWLQVMRLHLEGPQLACEEGCHLAEPLLELHCNVEGWNPDGSVVSCFSLSA